MSDRSPKSSTFKNKKRKGKNGDEDDDLDSKNHLKDRIDIKNPKYLDLFALETEC